MSFGAGTEGRSQRILIVRLGAMGDVIHTLPAVQGLRQAFPRAHIGWLIEERWAELLCASRTARSGIRSAERPLVDAVHAVRLKAWGQSIFALPTLQSVATVWNDVRAAHYDVAIDLQGAMRSAVLARLSGADVVYGAAEPWESPASLWYSRKVIAPGRHVIEQNCSIAEAMSGHRLKLSQAVLPSDPQAEARTEEGLAKHGIGDFAILNPGAGWGAKRWPAERYGEVARALSEARICPITNYGPGEEDIFRAVLAASGGRVRPTKGSITELIALMRRARLFIGGDTGPLHLAAALGVPVVGIYGPTDPARNGPFGTKSIVLRRAESLTSHARRAEAEAGLLEITSAAVVGAAEKLLGSRPPD